jgi:hypothetical protein
MTALNCDCFTVKTYWSLHSQTLKKRLVHNDVDKKQKDRKTERQKDRKTERQKERTERQKGQKYTKDVKNDVFFDDDGIEKIGNYFCLVEQKLYYIK